MYTLRTGSQENPEPSPIGNLRALLKEHIGHYKIKDKITKITKSKYHPGTSKANDLQKKIDETSDKDLLKMLNEYYEKNTFGKSVELRKRVGDALSIYFNITDEMICMSVIGQCDINEGSNKNSNILEEINRVRDVHIKKALEKRVSPTIELKEVGNANTAGESKESSLKKLLTDGINLYKMTGNPTGTDQRRANTILKTIGPLSDSQIFGYLTQLLINEDPLLGDSNTLRAAVDRVRVLYSSEHNKSEKKDLKYLAISAIESYKNQCSPDEAALKRANDILKAINPLKEEEAEVHLLDLLQNPLNKTLSTGHIRLRTRLNMAFCAYYGYTNQDVAMSMLKIAQEPNAGETCSNWRLKAVTQMVAAGPKSAPQAPEPASVPAPSPGFGKR